MSGDGISIWCAAHCHHFITQILRSHRKEQLSLYKLLIPSVTQQVATEHHNRQRRYWEMSVEKAESEGITWSKRSSLTLYYYLNALEGSAAFQSIYINFQQCFSSTVWELEEEKLREDEEELKGCLEDTRPELCRLKMTTSCLSLETKRSVVWFQMHYIVLLTYLAYEYPWS